MSAVPPRSGHPAALAAVAAGLAIAQQVAGKAARDAFFLSNFPVTALPVMLVVSAVVSVAAVLPASRVLAVHGPRRFVPGAFAGAAVVMALIAVLARRMPALAAVALYLHVAVIGALLISGFWSLVSEGFDPRSAKRQIGRIAAGGTLGGLLGGLAAERMSAAAGTPGVLLLLTGLLAAAALATERLGAASTGLAAMDTQEDAGLLAGVRALSRVRYLRDLAVLVAIVTVMAALLDYVFKARAAAAYRGHDLLRFFALFYVLTGALAFVMQAVFARRSLERLGLARTVAVMPGSVAAAAAAALAAPGLGTAAAARGVEAVLRHSLFRSGFELFFTPVPPQEKRSCRAVTDVGMERAGDALGGGTVRLVLLVLPAVTLPALTLLAAFLGVLAVVLALRLHRGYVLALERNLALRAIRLRPEDVADRTTRDTVLLSLSSPAVALPTGELHGGPGAGDAMEHAIAALRSGDPARVRVILAQPRLLEPAVAAHVIPLLGRDDLVNPAAAALRARAKRLCGQLVDALLDERQEFAVRRRLPRVLAGCPSQRAVDGLVEGLGDRRFEVRFQCGRALARLQHAAPQLRFDPQRIQAAVVREAELGRAVWESQQLVDAEAEGDVPPRLAALRLRGSRSLQHVFTLLALIMPDDPLRLAYQGITSPDTGLRGTALEYLETILPPALLSALGPLLQDDRPRAPAGPAGQSLEALLRSGASMRIDLAALRRGSAGSGPGGPAPPLDPGGGAAPGGRRPG